MSILRRIPPWSLLLLLHLMGLALYLDWREVLTNPPVADTDYATHWAEVWSISHYLDHGRLWGYDPYFMAGHPEGTIFNIDNKLIEVTSWALSRAGLPLPLAYNLVLLSLMSMAPLAFYPAGRLFGLSPRKAFLGGVAALCLWYLDPALRWRWQGGTLAFASTTCLSLLVLAAAVRLCRPGQVYRSALLIWFGLGPLLFWLHATTFLLLLIPLTTLTLLRWQELVWRQRLYLLLWPPLVLLVTAPWLVTAVRFSSYLAPSNQFLQGGLPALAADVLGIVRVDGASRPAHLGVRWLVLAIGGLGLWRQARHDWAFRPVGAAVVAGLLLAYGGVYLPSGGNLQPYRYIEQAALWSTIGIGTGLEAVWRFGWETGREQRGRRAAFLLLCGLALVWVGNGLRIFRPPLVGGLSVHRWQGPTADVHDLCHHLRGLPLESGRVMVMDTRVGALLPWCSGAQVIGGHFFEIWTQFGYTNSGIQRFLGMAYEAYDEVTMRQALDTYHVRWIVDHTTLRIPGAYQLSDWLADHPGLVTAGPQFGPYQLYEVIDAASLPAQAAHGGLIVMQVAADSLVLPYHWLPTLHAVPQSVQLWPQPIGDDPIPFIGVDPAGANSFVICNDGFCPGREN